MTPIVTVTLNPALDVSTATEAVAPAANCGARRRASTPAAAASMSAG
ncbi:MAG: hypothetical protein R3D46_10740 [Defluviimonas denitrificans]